jgi:hypothetical protein
MYSLWAHGTALAVENPTHIAGIAYRGWGAEVQVNPEANTWFHLPIPTAPVSDEGGAMLQSVFFDFMVDSAGTVLQLAVYNGTTNVWEPGADTLGPIEYGVPHQLKLDLPSPVAITRGIDLAINYEAFANTDSREPLALFSVFCGGIGFDYVRRPFEEREVDVAGERSPVAHR